MMATRVLMLMLVMIVVVIIDAIDYDDGSYNDEICIRTYIDAMHCIPDFPGSVHFTAV